MTKQTYKLINGDCIEEMKKMDANSIDSIVTDPPYEIGFMGKGWDSTGIAYNKDVWKEALRVLKPGGYMLAFSSTRTYHRMVCAIEDSGFEIRDQLAWIYGSGFPKSQNVGKMIDKKAGATRKVIGKTNTVVGPSMVNSKFGTFVRKDYISANDLTEPATDDAKKYEGWGTALKPAQEPIVLARKPLSEKTVAANVIKYGTGAIDIDSSRIATDTDDIPSAGNRTATFGTQETISGGDGSGGYIANSQGRWPANIIHDGSEEVLHLFPDSKGSAARFFYCAKANKQDRNDGCEEITAKSITNSKGNGLGRVCNICSASILKPCECENNSWILPVTNKNNHPTVKPTALMQYLVRMITPIGGTVLDPFNGSGSTGKAAMLLGKYNYVGIDLSADYIAISKHRIEHALNNASKDIKEDTTIDTTEEETNFFIE